MATATAEEQLLLELINQARLDPVGNASQYLSVFFPLISTNPDVASALDYFNVDGNALLNALQGLTPVGPVAWNSSLGTSAEQHSAAMIAADEQSHQVAGEASLGVRATTAGYNYQALGENVYAYAESVVYAHAAFMVDWGNGPDGMQDPAGHRINIMSAQFTEVGVDITHDPSASNDVGPLVVTEDFGFSGKYFVTGVAYNDSDHNNFYSIGEGLSGLNVGWNGTSVSSADAGGYSLAVSQGTGRVVTLSGAGLAGTVTVTTSILGENLKLDIVNGNTLLTSGSIAVDGPVSIIKGLGVEGLELTAGAGNQEIDGTEGQDTISGGAGNDIINGGGDSDHLNGEAGNDLIEGGSGSDLIDGGAGIDTAIYSNVHTRYIFKANSDGSFVINGGGAGTDTLTNIEFFRFSDGQYRWDAASGSLQIVANTAPTVASTQAVLTTVGTAKQLTVTGTDTDGDNLTYAAGTALHGTVAGGYGGVFTYTPGASYTGPDSFKVTVSDGRGGTASQTVSVTVKEPNAAPTVNATQSVSTSQGVAKQVTVQASDLDGDPLTFSAETPSHGTVTGGSGGVFTYTPAAGFSGSDSFFVLVDDGHGNSSTQRVDVQVTFVAPSSSAGESGSPFSLFMSNGMVDHVGGSGTITGTNGFQDVTLLDQPGSIVFGGSFNRGGDIIRFPLDAGAYTIALSGSVVELTDGTTSYSIPIGTNGTDLVFADGVRELVYDDVANLPKIGGQSFGGTPAPITAPTDHSPLPTGADPEAAGRLFLTGGAVVSLMGNHDVYGTQGVEDIYYLGGDMNLGASFNRGGDTLYLPLARSAYDADLSGSVVILTSLQGEITIPIGTAGMTLNFLGTELVLRLDTTSGNVLLGNEIIASTGTGNPDPGSGDEVSIDIGSATNTIPVQLADGTDYTLTDAAGIDSFVRIIGFDAGDVIHITGATASDYNFTKGDGDGDGIADDLMMSYRPSTGGDNLITIVDAFTHEGFVYSAASAIAAVGSEFVTFG